MTSNDEKADVENAILKTNILRNGKWFEANLAGISQLKRVVHGNAKEFLFLRKGEDFGAFIEMLYELMAHEPEQIEKTFSLYFSRFPEVSSSFDLKKLLNIDWAQMLAFYLLITKGGELAIGSWKKMKSILDERRYKGKIPDLRILCNPDEINEIARIGWEDMGFQVRHYKEPALAGSHRFYLSEKEYCFFIRKPDSTFFGFRGSDQKVILDLRSQFDLEWENSEG